MAYVWAWHGWQDAPAPRVAAGDAPKHRCLFLFEKHRRHEYSASSAVNIQGYASPELVIPTKAFARDYEITGVRLSVCLFVCYHDN